MKKLDQHPRGRRQRHRGCAQRRRERASNRAGQDHFGDLPTAQGTGDRRLRGKISVDLPNLIAAVCKHDPEKACPGLDPGYAPRPCLELEDKLQSGGHRLEMNKQARTESEFVRAKR